MEVRIAAARINRRQRIVPIRRIGGAPASRKIGAIAAQAPQ
jgi:hypothetical protein